MKKIAEIVRPAALRGLHPARQLAVWLAFHELSQADLAKLCDVKQGTLAAVVGALRTSAPVLECVERVTGIPAGAWKLEQATRGE
ncbi:MAG TPA: hypothetical protein VNB06_05560 [Thermoanaerobaculia bacterium]|nr:hypothetical protein [Thermoanaerobaculia bacterium]